MRILGSARAYVVRKSAKALMDARNFDAAFLRYEVLRETSGVRPSDVVAHAKAAESLGRKDVAAKIHERNIALFPIEPNVHRQMGLFLLRTGQDQLAALAFARGAVLAPNNEPLKTDLDRMGVKEEHLPAVAVAAFKAMKPGQAKRADRLKMIKARQAADKAKGFRQSGDWRGALGVQQIVVQNNPHNGAAQIRMGHVYKELGRAKDAEVAYWRGVALSHNDADAYIQLGHGLKLARKRNAALPAYLAASQIQPDISSLAAELKEFSLSDEQKRSWAEALKEGQVSLLIKLADGGDGSDGKSKFKRNEGPPIPRIMDVLARALAGDIARSSGVTL